MHWKCRTSALQCITLSSNLTSQSTVVLGSDQGDPLEAKYEGNARSVSSLGNLFGGQVGEDGNTIGAEGLGKIDS